jgi:hypothetical protein
MSENAPKKTLPVGQSFFDRVIEDRAYYDVQPQLVILPFLLPYLSSFLHHRDYRVPANA